MPQTRPTPPILGAGHHAGAQCIAFRVSTNRREMLVFCDGERLESSLVSTIGSHRATRQVPASRVRIGQPPQGLGKIAILAGPQNPVPMIRQEAKGEPTHGHLLAGFLQHFFQGGVVLGGFKNRCPSHGPVQHVVHITAGCIAMSSRHWPHPDHAHVEINRYETRPTFLPLPLCVKSV